MTGKVLIVDDSTMVRKQVSRALTGAGFDVVEASDGQDALEKLGSNADVTLVVCDINMPGMSGIEVLESFVATKDRPSPAFVMLTTESQPDMIQRARALGAKGWILKPFKAELLVATARKLTEKAA